VCRTGEKGLILDVPGARREARRFNTVWFEGLSGRVACRLLQSVLVLLHPVAPDLIRIGVVDRLHRDNLIAAFLMICRSPKLDRGLSKPHSLAVFSVNVVDQRFIAQINHHGMVLIIEPASEFVEAPVLRPD
jgi:hypothetical protein